MKKKKRMVTRTTTTMVVMMMMMTHKKQRRRSVHPPITVASRCAFDATLAWRSSIRKTTKSTSWRIISGNTRIGHPRIATFVAAYWSGFGRRDFSVEPATTTARNCSKVDRICAKRRGPVGKLVEHVGRRIAEKSMPELNAEAQQMTAQIVSDKFDQSASALVDSLNETTQADELIFKHFPEVREWKFRTAARTDFLVAGLGPPSVDIPKFLLEEGEPVAHVELWMKLTPGQAALLELIGEFDIVYDVLRETVGEEGAKRLENDVTLDRHGEWSVIRAGSSTAKQ